MRVIALEGVDGCGKSAVAAGIQRALLGGGRMCFVADPAGFGLIGQLLRSHIVDPGVELNADLDAVLFAALRAEGGRAILSTLQSEQATTIVLERWSHALAAYGAADTARPQLVSELRKLLANTLTVDVAILLDIPGALAFRRAQELPDPNKFETRGAKYLELVASSYRELAAGDQNLEIVDASEQPDVTLDRVRAVLEARWPDWAHTSPENQLSE